jgi:succinate dehydrogenase/fumarate reductase flavoprotein subunit
MTITYALIEGVEKAAKETPDRCRIITKARVNRLLTSEGKVIGVVYEKDGKSFEEFGCVVICTGGYAHDYGEDSLLKRYRPELMKFPTTNGSYCTGDGIKMSVAIGADTADMEWV